MIDTIAQSWDGIIQWLRAGQNALSIAQLVAAFVTALATIALWRVTRVLAKETRSLADLTNRPFVVCNFESSPAYAHALDLVLRNDGNASAFDIEANINPPLPMPNGSEDEKSERAKLFRVALLAPGQKLSRKGVMARDILNENYEVEVSWALLPKAIERQTLKYQITATDGFRAGWNVKGEHHIAEELEKIRKHLMK